MKLLVLKECQTGSGSGSYPLLRVQVPTAFIVCRSRQVLFLSFFVFIFLSPPLRKGAKQECLQQVMLARRLTGESPSEDESQIKSGIAGRTVICLIAETGDTTGTDLTIWDSMELQGCETFMHIHIPTHSI